VDNVSPDVADFFGSKGSPLSGMFILTERQKNKSLYGEPLEPEELANSVDNVHPQLYYPVYKRPE